MLGSDSYSESYSYSDGEDGDGSLTQMTTGTDDTVAYTYDQLKRLHQKDVQIAGSEQPLSTVYGYRTVSGNQSSTQVEYYNVVNDSEYHVKNQYTYDANGNIVQVAKDFEENGVYYPIEEYTYDSQNQLTREIRKTYTVNTTVSLSSRDTYTYAYDTAGNIREEKKNGTVTKSYTYAGDDSNASADWQDLLTEFNGHTITYDASGNPETYYDGSTMQWDNGQQLTLIRKNSPRPSVIITFNYDADGIRTKKSVTRSTTNKTHNYITQNGKVMRDIITGRNGKIAITTKVLDFIYDESGMSCCNSGSVCADKPACQSPCCCHSFTSLAPAPGGGRFAPHSH